MILALFSFIFGLFFSIPVFLCCFSCCLAETNRSPFDFSEGESELVSGFDVEYGGGGFSLLFISEYSSMIFMCFLTSVMFLVGDFYYFYFFIKMNILCFLLLFGFVLPPLVTVMMSSCIWHEGVICRYLWITYVFSFLLSF